MLRTKIFTLLPLVLCSCISQSKAPELRAVVPSPTYTKEQAHAICYAEAKNADAGYPVPAPASRALDFGFPNSVNTNCSTIGTFTSCTSTPSGGGGFASGFAEAYAKETARRESRPPRPDERSLYFACLAKLGYVAAD